jgi:hypothetical protein
VETSVSSRPDEDGSIAMQSIPLFLAAVAFAAAAMPARPAVPNTLWSASTAAAHGGRISPGRVPEGARTFNGQLAAADGAGNLYVVATQGDESDACITTLKYLAGTGAIAWQQEACGARNTWGSAIAVDSSGNVFTAGTSGGDFRLIKYSGSNGAVLWDQRQGTDAFEAAFGIALDTAGNAYLLGTALGANNDLKVIKHRSSDGAPIWQASVDRGGDDAPAGIAADRSGHAAVVGLRRDAAGNEDWYVLKLNAADGAVLWHSEYDAGRSDIPAHMALDDAGNVIVTGYSALSDERNVMKTVKYLAGTGARMWEASFGAAGYNGSTAVRTDAQGDVFVTGFATVKFGDDDITTLKYAGASGALLWQARYAGTRAGMEAGRALAVDADGNAIVTGMSYTQGESNPDFRTLKYSGADGSELWNAAYRGTGFGPGDSGYAVVAAGAAVYSVGLATEAGAATALRVFKFGDKSVATQPALAQAHNVQGLWWRAPAGSESGWGLNLTQQGETLFGTWFTYDAKGEGMWLVMPNGARVGDDRYSGTLYRTRGPAFDASPYRGDDVIAIPVGTATLSFTDGDHGSFEYTVDGIAGAKPIERQVYASPLPTCTLGGSAAAAANYQALWWASPAGAESGWGLNITHQGDILFVTWFTYGPDGKAMWLVGSRVARIGAGSYSGTLYRTVGPPFDTPSWNPAMVAPTPVGQVTLTFADAEHGTFAYAVNGVSRSKPITRQVYSAPATVCR